MDLIAKVDLVLLQYCLGKLGSPDAIEYGEQENTKKWQALHNEIVATVRWKIWCNIDARY
jgi:hypothetical protein